MHKQGNAQKQHDKAEAKKKYHSHRPSSVHYLEYGGWVGWLVDWLAGQIEPPFFCICTYLVTERHTDRSIHPSIHTQNLNAMQLNTAARRATSTCPLFFIIVIIIIPSLFTFEILDARTFHRERRHKQAHIVHIQ